MTDARTSRDPAPAPAPGGRDGCGPAAQAAQASSSSSASASAAGHRARHRAVHQHRHQPEHDGRARTRAGRCRPSRRQNVGPAGAAQVSVPADGGGERHAGGPAVLRELVPELPPGAAPAGGGGAARRTRRAARSSRIRVIGVDSVDTTSSARSFIHERGGHLPRGLRPRRQHHRAGSSTSTVIPTPCSSTGTARSPGSCAGAVLTPSSFTADERALIPSGT